MGSAPQEMKYTENCPACTVITMRLVLIELGAGEVKLWLCPRAVQCRSELLCSPELFDGRDTVASCIGALIVERRDI